MYRIAQGALANVVQHAEAKHLTLRMRRQAQRLELSVRDDGRGFRQGPDMDMSKKLGLVTMRERAELAGGTLSVQSTEGRGTEVRLLLPI